MSGKTDIAVKMALAIAAQEAGDFAGAIIYLRSAKMLMLKEGDTTIGESRQTYTVEGIDRTIADPESASSAAAGMTFNKVEYI